MPNRETTMPLPTVISHLYDRGHDIHYYVTAYRKLSKPELARYIPGALRQLETQHRPRPGGLHQIISMIGHGERRERNSI